MVQTSDLLFRFAAGDGVEHVACSTGQGMQNRTSLSPTSKAWEFRRQVASILLGCQACYRIDSGKTRTGANRALRDVGSVNLESFLLSGDRCDGGGRFEQDSGLDIVIALHTACDVQIANPLLPLPLRRSR